MSRRAIRVGVALLVLAVLVAGWAWQNAVASAPDGAPWTLRATVRPPITTGHAQECLDRIQNDNGWLDLCWEISYVAEVASGDQEYLLRLYGTLSGKDAISGIHWMALRTVPKVEEMAILLTTPDGIYTGPCTQLQIRGLVGRPREMTTNVDICGRTTVDRGWGPAYHNVTLSWACQHCVLAMSGSQGVGLAETVWVPNSTPLPEWEIYADIG